NGEIDAAILQAALSGTIKKTYDGNTTATLGGNYQLTGLVGNETVGLLAGNGNYDTKDVGTGKTVTFGNLTLSSGTGNASNYSLGNVTVLSGTNGEIDAAILQAALSGTIKKTYDGNTTATLGSNYQLTGLV